MVSRSILVSKTAARLGRSAREANSWISGVGRKPRVGEIEGPRLLHAGQLDLVAEGQFVSHGFGHLAGIAEDAVIDNQDGHGRSPGGHERSVHAKRGDTLMSVNLLGVSLGLRGREASGTQEKFEGDGPHDERDQAFE
jgi:hypothetical protein